MELPICFNRLVSLEIIKETRQMYEKEYKELEDNNKEIDIEELGQKCIRKARHKAANAKYHEKRKKIQENKINGIDETIEKGISERDYRFKSLMEEKGQEIYDYSVIHKIPKTTLKYGITSYMVKKIMKAVNDQKLINISNSNSNSNVSEEHSDSEHEHDELNTKLAEV